MTFPIREGNKNMEKKYSFIELGCFMGGFVGQYPLKISQSAMLCNFSKSMNCLAYKFPIFSKKKWKICPILSSPCFSPWTAEFSAAPRVVPQLPPALPPPPPPARQPRPSRRRSPRPGPGATGPGGSAEARRRFDGNKSDKVGPPSDVRWL